MATAVRGPMKTSTKRSNWAAGDRIDADRIRPEEQAENDLGHLVVDEIPKGLSDQGPGEGEDSQNAYVSTEAGSHWRRVKYRSSRSLKL